MAPKRGHDSLLDPAFKRLRLVEGSAPCSGDIYFNSLSDEVVLLIFSNLLDFRDLVVCNQVDKHWATLSDDNSLWKRLFLRDNPSQRLRGGSRCFSPRWVMEAGPLGREIKPLPSKLKQTVLYAYEQVEPELADGCAVESIAGNIDGRPRISATSCGSASQNLVVAGETIISAVGLDLMISCSGKSPHRIPSSNQIACIALDHSTITSQVSALHAAVDIRVACLYNTGAFMVLSIPDHNPERTSILHSVQPAARSTGSGAREAVYKHPLVISISLDSELAIWDLRSPTRPIHKLLSYISFPPLSLSLSSTSNTWKLLVAHCAPVYPSHWLPAASEITLEEEAGRFRVVGSRKTPSLAASSGWVTEQESREMEIEWSKKLGRVEIMETDGKFLVIAGVDSVLQLYRVYYKPKFRLSYVSTLTGHTFGIDTLTVTDGRCVSVGKDGKLRIWDLEGGWASQVTTAFELQNTETPKMRGLAFDERRVVILDSVTGALQIWRFDL
ncbi:hypothetical protein FRB93_000472 [Tulasnella sp. JGI-2019a]|nr:hypothetical protein FRB93_000472 [Tulasnella sp. JGI-2019a]